MNAKRLSPAAPVLFAALLASGCSTTREDYPSLSTRDAERVSGEMAVATVDSAQAPAPLPADTLKRTAALLERARAADGDFQAQLPSTRNTAQAASGLGPESNQWSRAQVALADLRTHRSDAAIALGDLDLIYVDATLEFTQRATVAAARDEVAAIVASHDRTLDQLFRLLSL